MILSAISRKHDLLDKAQQYRRTKIYVTDNHNYIEGLLHQPDRLSAYKTGQTEPVVDPADYYNLDQNSAWLTINHYNALVLNTRNMLIADIDFGDKRLNRFAGASGCDEVIDGLGALSLLDENLGYPDFKFADQSYAVYRTHSGCRAICTSICIPWDKMGWAAERFMRFLGGDPEYIQLCDIQKCYRARLTPKPWRMGDVSHVCNFVDKHGEGTVHPDLKEQLALHDEMTLRENEHESFLA